MKWIYILIGAVLLIAGATALLILSKTKGDGGDQPTPDPDPDPKPDPTCHKVGESCDSVTDCCTHEFCNATKKCEKLHAQGEKCDHTADCEEPLFCDANNNTCQSCFSEGGKCSADHKCCGKLICDNGVCKKDATCVDKSPCSVDGDCCHGKTCIAGKCSDHCATLNDACTKSDDCCNTLQCKDGKCHNPCTAVGGKCDPSDHDTCCGTGVCISDGKDGGVCKDCKKDGGVCKTNGECCDSTSTCFSDPGLTEPICKKLYVCRNAMCVQARPNAGEKSYTSLSDCQKNCLCKIVPTPLPGHSHTWVRTLTRFKKHSNGHHLSAAGLSFILGRKDCATKFDISVYTSDRKRKYNDQNPYTKTVFPSDIRTKFLADLGAFKYPIYAFEVRAGHGYAIDGDSIYFADPNQLITIQVTPYVKDSSGKEVKGFTYTQFIQPHEGDQNWKDFISI